MSLSIPIREPRGHFLPNPFRMCRCKQPQKPRLLSPLECADAKPPRICTFYSHLKSNHFNRYTGPPDNPFRMCRYKYPGGWGAGMTQIEISGPPPQVRMNPASVLLATRHLSTSEQDVDPERVFESKSHSPLVLCFQSLTNSYALNFKQLLYSQAITHSQGGGGWGGLSATESVPCKLALLHFFLTRHSPLVTRHCLPSSQHGQAPSDDDTLSTPRSLLTR
jgi:hypothetical protein